MPAQNVPVELLRRYLADDAPAREASVVKLMVALLLSAVPVTVALIGVTGTTTALRNAATELALAAWYAGVWLALSRRRWHRALPFVNVTLEVTIPLLLIAELIDTRGAIAAGTTPLYVAWAGLVMLSAARMSRALSVLAGAVAALECLLLYFLAIAPRMPADAPASAAAPGALLRGFLLLLCGAGAALIAHLLIKNAERALRTVRSQDLMSKYVLHEVIGRGGMAEVLRATYSPEGGFEKPVAIKRVRPELTTDPRFAAMFLEEARLCGSLSHPNIVQVLDCGRFADQFIMAMEWVNGASLARLIKQRAAPLPPAAVACLGVQLAAALDYIHRQTRGEGGQPLVHRDVNPPNVLVSRRGEVKLADFGIARALDTVEERGKLYGKVRYLPPEVLAGLPADPRADLYGLGLSLHEALTGEPAVTADTAALLNQPLLALPAPSRRAHVPPALEALVMKLLDREPAQRPTAAALRDGLLQLGGDAAPFPLGQEQLVAAVAELAAVSEHRERSPETATATEAAGGSDQPTRSLRPAG